MGPMFQLARHIAQGRLAASQQLVRSTRACLCTSAVRTADEEIPASKFRGRLDRRIKELHEHAIVPLDPQVIAWSRKREETIEDFEWTGKTIAQMSAFWAVPFLLAWLYINGLEDEPAPFPYYTCHGCWLNHYCKHCATIKKRCLIHTYEDEPRPVPMPMSTVFELENPDGQKIVWDGYLRNNLNIYEPIPLEPKSGTNRKAFDHWTRAKYLESVGSK